ncbi:hypothetical protein C2G38_2227934 [Gigaspora rosea]|uniref:C2H2-type domain-containing protein n=1 Tax=Gigaspora rosea TaxID=44941 RepID=A0A397U4R0_9GLOM|nr:hypothetical protein C2G38_2227934 [Gigaspora rosea]
METNDPCSYSYPIVLISNYTLQQEFKCEICEIKFKTKRGFNCHQSSAVEKNN